ncbi:uncharacterized protein VP01_6396g1, partial [Puccinia sorghi]
MHGSGHPGHPTINHVLAAINNICCGNHPPPHHILSRNNNCTCCSGTGHWKSDCPVSAETHSSHRCKVQVTLSPFMPNLPLQISVVERKTVS